MNAAPNNAQIGMARLTETYIEPERAERPSDMIAELWRHRLVILLTGLAFLLGGVVYLHLAEYKYTGEMRVVASQAPGNNTSVTGGRLGNLASLVGISTESGSASPFKLYLEELTSREVATALVPRSDLMRIIFKREWDVGTRRWRRPEPTPFRDGLKALLGFPQLQWQAPDAARLQDYLRQSIKIDDDPKRAVTIVRFDHADPKFATKLLSALNVAADRHLKTVALARANQFARYLDARLATVVVAEHRVALTTALSDQEKQIMLASSDAPYAADLVEAPTASLAPTSPRAIIVLVTSLLFGMVFGTLGTMGAIAIARYRHDSRFPAAIDHRAPTV